MMTRNFYALRWLAAVRTCQTTGFLPPTSENMISFLCAGTSEIGQVRRRLFETILLFEELAKRETLHPSRNYEPITIERRETETIERERERESIFVAGEPSTEGDHGEGGR